MGGFVTVSLIYFVRAAATPALIEVCPSPPPSHDDLGWPITRAYPPSDERRMRRRVAQSVLVGTVLVSFVGQMEASLFGPLVLSDAFRRAFADQPAVRCLPGDGDGRKLAAGLGLILAAHSAIVAAVAAAVWSPPPRLLLADCPRLSATMPH